LSGASVIYCFDIDGTLCSNTEGNYLHAVPYRDVINSINRIFDEGHQVILYTARGSTTGIDWRDVTERQLKEWGLRYHTLFMGKPTADVYIDDKAINATDWRHKGFGIGGFSPQRSAKG
jgi:dTDP-glucose 4,6-dehydratase